MERLRFVACAIAPVAALALLAAPAAAGPNDPETTANTLVNQCASIKKGESVLVTGRPSDMALLEAVCVQVRKQGGFPLLSVGTDKMARRMYDEVPASLDSQTDEFGVKLAGIVDAIISVDSTENEALFADASPARMAARAKAGMEMEQALLKRNVKRVSLGNGLFPTKATAAQFGVDREQLAEIFWSGVNVDYSALQSTGTKVKNAIDDGKQMRITNPNGTDISFRIEHRSVFVSDGAISKDDISKGGPACQVWLPAGEVYSTPGHASAEGKVVFDRIVFQGSEITNVTMTFRESKMLSMTGTGIEKAKALYDAAGTGKDQLAYFDFGINPNVKAPAGSKLQSWVQSGMVSLGIGGNTWAGGKNECAYSFGGFIPGSTVLVDGKTLIDKGVLKE